MASLGTVIGTQGGAAVALALIFSPLSAVAQDQTSPQGGSQGAQGGWSEPSTQPAPAQPAPTQAAPTQAAPPQPAPTQPAPAQPGAEQPAPAQPAAQPGHPAGAPQQGAPQQGYPPGHYPPGHYAPGHYPPGYPPPPGYYPPPPPPDERPRYLPFRENAPAPPGYYFEERARRGPIIAGAVVFGVPYALGLAIAAGDNFSNQSGWLAVPALGPWITLAARKKCSTTLDTDDICASDAGVRTMLVLDGLMQVTGATLLIWGLSSPTKRYVRNDISLQVAPTRVGQGYGLGAFGTF